MNFEMLDNMMDVSNIMNTIVAIQMSWCFWTEHLHTDESAENL